MKITEKQIEEMAMKYAETENSAYTNDYYGFINGFKKALTLYGVVKSLKDKEEQAFEVWFRINCKQIAENEFLYIDTTYTKEHIFQKWYFKDL